MAFGNRLIDAGGVSGPDIGDLAEGGVVFYVDGSGGGLVATLNNNYAPMLQCTNNNVGTSTAFGTGESNTNALFALGTPCIYSSVSIGIAVNATEGGYTDWYSPSLSELQTMYDNVGPTSAFNNIVGFYLNSKYISSSTYPYNPQTQFGMIAGTNSRSNYFEPANYNQYFKYIRAF